MQWSSRVGKDGATAAAIEIAHSRWGSSRGSEVTSFNYEAFANPDPHSPIGALLVVTSTYPDNHSDFELCAVSRVGKEQEMQQLLDRHKMAAAFTGMSKSAYQELEKLGAATHDRHRTMMFGTRIDSDTPEDQRYPAYLKTTLEKLLNENILSRDAQLSRALLDKVGDHFISVGTAIADITNERDSHAKL